MSGSTTQRMATSEQPHATPSGNMGQKIAYAFGNLGQHRVLQHDEHVLHHVLDHRAVHRRGQDLRPSASSVITGLIVVIRIARSSSTRCSAASWTT